MKHLPSICSIALLCSMFLLSTGHAAGQYQNFQASIYARVYEVRQMGDLGWLEPRWNEISRQVKIDKIYLETHRDMIVADKEAILKVKKFFQDHGVKVAGGIALTVNEMNRFQTYCYSNPEHRKKLKEVVEFTAGLFDEIILDDFFFTNCKAIVKSFRGQPNLSPDIHILIPQIQYLTNDVWELFSGMTQNDLGYPLMLQAGYGKGTLYVLTVPENFSDLYSFPSPILTQIRNVLLRDLFVRVESPGDVSLFVYDNNTFIVESFLPESVEVRISTDSRFTKIQELTTGQEFSGQSSGVTGFGGFGAGGSTRLIYPLKINPHSYRVFSVKQ